jgi:hypothetical protein
MPNPETLIASPAMRARRFALAVFVLLLLAGCGGDGGNDQSSKTQGTTKTESGGDQTYTDFPASARCPTDRFVGEPTDFVLRLHNNSGHIWQHTIYGKEGDDHFVKHGVTDQRGRPGIPLQDGTGHIDFGRTPAGASRTITASGTPKDAGNYKVKLTIWGADDESALPDSFPAVTCSVAVDPSY